MLALRHQGAGCDSDRPALGRPKDLWLRRRRHARASRAGLTRRLLIAASDRASHARARSKNYAYQNWEAHLSGALRPDCGLARLWEPQIQEYARTRARVF